MSESSPVRYTTVVCRVCGTRLDERQDDAPRNVVCEMCHSPVTVPAASATAPASKTLKPLEDVEGYRLENPSESAGERKKRTEHLTLVVCPICYARLHLQAKKESYQQPCPDCHELVRIPSRSEVKAKRERDKPTLARDPVEALPVPESTVKRREYSQWYLHSQSHIRREPDAVPPRSLYFSNTFTLPWQREVVSRWVYLSVGLTVCTAIAWVLIQQFQEAGGYGGLVMAFFALPLIWVLLWTLSYAAAVWLVVAIDTGNGNREIINWGEQNWREWILQLFYVEYLGGISAAIAHGIGLLAELAGLAYWPTFAAAFTLGFPIVTVSSFERGGSWNIFSGAVIRSLWRHPLVWLGFFVLSGIVLVGWTALWVFLLGIAPIAAIALGGIGWATILLIHARLLGRLAWGVSLE